MRAAALLALVATLVLAPAAAAETLGVGIQQDAYGPGDLDALPGDVVAWTNVSARTHTVTADDGAFDSGVLEPEGRFELPVAQPGVIAYHCTLHPSMTGAVVVAPVTLDVLPVLAVPAGDPVVVSGRAAPAAPVVVSEVDAAGVSRVVASAAAAADGTWRTTVTAQRTGSLVAGVPAGTSRPRKLLVSDRKVALTVRGRTVTVKVTPPLPYGRVALQSYRRERFGWWFDRRRKLDYVSETTFRVPAARRPYRVVLLDADGWTPLATSRTVHAWGLTPVMREGTHHGGH